MPTLVVTKFQRTLGVVIWIVFSVETIRFVVWPPPFFSRELFDNAQEAIGILVFSFVASAVFAGVFNLGMPRSSRFASYRHFVENAQLKWIPVMCFAGGGGLALLNGLRASAPQGFLQFPLFMFSAGLGVLVGNVLGIVSRRRGKIP